MSNNFPSDIDMSSIVATKGESGDLDIELKTMNVKSEPCLMKNYSCEYVPDHDYQVSKYWLIRKLQYFWSFRWWIF